jgi:adenylate cyclase class IV
MREVGQKQRFLSQMIPITGSFRKSPSEVVTNAQRLNNFTKVLSSVKVMKKAQSRKARRKYEVTVVYNIT